MKNKTIHYSFFGLSSLTSSLFRRWCICPKSKKSSGFTLVELMVVMAIIAILATAGLSAFTSYLKGARDSKRIRMAQDMKTIVESMTSMYGAPAPAELNAYLISEGLAWDIVMPENILISVADIMSRTVDDIFHLVGISSAWALLKDPVEGKTVCLNHTFNAAIVCQFVYYRFSDGTYAISYGVEKKENLVNPHYSNKSTPRTYGSFIGNSAAITIIPTTPTTNIEDETTALGALGITSVDAVSISTIPIGSANSGCNGVTCLSGESCTGGVCVDPCVATPVPGTVCADQSKYVSATLRTTPSDAGALQWGPYGAITGATSNTDGEWNTNRIVTNYALASYPAFKTCYDLVAHGHDDWYLPAKDELNLLYINRGAIGGFSSASWPTSQYWSSSETTGYYAWMQFFQTGEQFGQNGADKNGAKRVRCVRTP